MEWLRLMNAVVGEVGPNLDEGTNRTFVSRCCEKIRKTSVKISDPCRYFNYEFFAYEQTRYSCANRLVVYILDGTDCKMASNSSKLQSGATSRTCETAAHFTSPQKPRHLSFYYIHTQTSAHQVLKSRVIIFRVYFSSILLSQRFKRYAYSFQIFFFASFFNESL
jgi:hypothetical protein